MFLWKWYLKYRYQKTLKRTERLRETESERQRCLGLLNEITTAQFSLYGIDSGLSTMIKVPDQCIDTYTERMKKIQRQLKQDRLLQVEDFNWSLKNVSVDRFLTSTTGFYQDVEKAVERLKVAATAVCVMAAKLDDAEYGKNEHNSRLLTKLFINMQEVSKALIEVSLTN